MDSRNSSPKASGTADMVDGNTKTGKQDTSPEAPAHTPGTGKGEEKATYEGKEAGRHDTGDAGAGRPAGTSTARNSTSVNAEEMEPIDPDMPNMPPA